MKVVIAVILVKSQKAEIVEIMNGEKKGHFLFSADKVKRLDQFYRIIIGLLRGSGCLICT